MTDGDSQYLADRANDAEFSDNRCQFFVKIICENVTMWVVLIKYRIYFFLHFLTLLLDPVIIALSSIQFEVIIVLNNANYVLIFVRESKILHLIQLNSEFKIEFRL